MIRTHLLTYVLYSRWAVCPHTQISLPENLYALESKAWSILSALCSFAFAETTRTNILISYIKQTRQYTLLDGCDLSKLSYTKLPSFTLCIYVFRLLLILESAYQLVTVISIAVVSWLIDKYMSWKFRHEPSNSSSSFHPELSENITLPSTGMLLSAVTV